MPLRSYFWACFPWWVAKDVCDILAIKNSRHATAQLDDDEKASVVLSDARSGQSRRQTIINESGLYALVLRSDKPEAKRLKKWLTSVVLPELRKTGEYRKDCLGVPDAPRFDSSDPMLATLEVCIAMRREQISLDQRVTALEQNRESAQEAIRALPAPTRALPELSLRDQCRRAVDNLARVAGMNHHETWSRVYREYDYRYKTNMTVVSRNKGIPKISLIEEAGRLDALYAIIMGMTEKISCQA